MTATKHHQKRLRKERWFLMKTRAALIFALMALAIMLFSIFSRGITAFYRNEIQLELSLQPETLGLQEGQNIRDLSPSAYNKPVQQALKNLFPEVTDTSLQRKITGLIGSSAGATAREAIEREKKHVGETISIWVPVNSKVDLWLKNSVGGNADNVGEEQQAWIAKLKKESRLKTRWNSNFFQNADSRQPEQAGFAGALVGSLYLLLVCFSVAFPLGVMTAVYLEEFAPAGKWVDIIEVNINNLAAVPSIVYGLLGLSIYLNALHLPRSSAIVGGLTLAMLILPVIIIATRSSLRSVPHSIRDAARAMGATPVQTVWHHTLPLSMPGIMTGTILGLARAIGETAPLLMIGMVAFIADIPSGLSTPATVMPVQIYLWASSAEAGFAEKTAAGIMMLLLVLMTMNAAAVYIRKKFEVKW